MNWQMMRRGMWLGQGAGGHVPLVWVLLLGSLSSCSTPNTPPKAELYFPPADSVLYPGILTVMGQVSDAETEALDLSASCEDAQTGLSFPAVITEGGEAVCTSSSSLEEGEYYISLTVLDPDGATGTSAELHVTLYDAPPSVMIEVPSDGSTDFNQDSQITFIAYVQDPDQPEAVALQCVWSSDGTPMGTAEVDSATERCTLSGVQLSGGTHAITVSVADDYGKTASDQLPLPIRACTDQDNDGYFVDCGDTRDCNDGDSSINPLGTEVCDGVDNDCDGQADNVPDGDGDGIGPCQGDCDDSDPSVSPAAAEVCDGVDNNCALGVDEGFDQDFDLFSQCDGDCDDTNPDVSPRAQEECDGIDNDCNGLVDDGVQEIYYNDVDLDGYGDGSDPVLACSQPAGTVLNGNDCGDGDPAIYPGAEERCNGLDDDCDGAVDEGTDPLTFYVDGDGDGVGDSEQGSVQGCVVPDGYAAESGDCDDGEAAVYPGALEVCDGMDNNCDGSVDEGVVFNFYRDADGDGYGVTGDKISGCEASDGYVLTSGDCDDGDASVNPGALETCDGVDENCNGVVDDDVTARTWYRDADGDGYGSTTDSLDDCAEPAGYILEGGDCDDSDPAINPDAVEICNGSDDDCDGQFDEAVQTQYWVDADADLFGDGSTPPVQACEQPAGYVTNDDDCDDGSASSNPDATEACDGLDNNCNDVIDEGHPQSPFYWDADADGYGDAEQLMYACAAPPGYVSSGTDCDDGDEDVHPGAVETCDTLDNDCDGIRDEDTECYDDDGDGYTELEGDCDDGNNDVSPELPEWASANGLDDDCDGIVDENTTCWDDDGDAFVEAADVTNCPGYPDAYGGDVPGSEDCDDGEDQIYPGAPERYNGLDDDCDGAVDGVIALHATPIQFVGDMEGAALGAAMAGLGDINGDGFDDLAVGAPHRDFNTGAVYVIFGKDVGWTAGQVDGMGLSLMGEEADAQAGFAIAPAGDMDRDGLADFAIGAPYMSTTANFNGRMYLLYGKESGWADANLSTARNAYTDGYFNNVLLGYSLAGGGDVDGDGWDDLAMGVPWPATPATGYLMVLPGKSTRYVSAAPPDQGPIDGSEFLQFVGAAKAAIGMNVAYVHGYDDDEVDDIVISGFGSVADLSNAGAVYVLPGWEDYTTGPIYNVAELADGPYRGESDFEEVGHTVADAGDVDGDGNGDFLVGRKLQTSTDQDLAYLFLGGVYDRGENSIQVVADVYFSGDMDACPCSAAGVGDVNNDGFSDFAIGLANSDAGGTDSGAVYLFYGGNQRSWLGTIDLSEADAILVGSPGEEAGSSLAPAGDVDQDGFSDFLIGAPGYDGAAGVGAGRAYLLFGFSTP